MYSIKLNDVYNIILKVGIFCPAPQNATMIWWQPLSVLERSSMSCLELYCYHVCWSSSKDQLCHGIIRMMWKCPTLFTYFSLSLSLSAVLLLVTQASDQSVFFLWLLLHNVGFYLPKRHQMSQLPAYNEGRGPAPLFFSLSPSVIIGAGPQQGPAYVLFSHFHMNPGTCFNFSCNTVWNFVVHNSIQLCDVSQVYFLARK